MITPLSRRPGYLMSAKGVGSTISSIRSLQIMLGVITGFRGAYNNVGLSIGQTLGVVLPHAFFGLYCICGSAAGDRLEGIFVGIECLLSASAAALQCAANIAFTNESYAALTLVEWSGGLLLAAVLTPLIMVLYDVIFLPSVALVLWYRNGGKEKMSTAISIAKESLSPPRKAKSPPKKGKGKGKGKSSPKRPSSELPPPLKLPEPVRGGSPKSPKAVSLKPAPPAKERPGMKMGRSFKRVHSRVGLAHAIVEWKPEEQTAAVKLQSAFRRREAKRMVHVIKEAVQKEKERLQHELFMVIRVQTRVRGFLARRPEVTELARLHKCCTAFQRKWRIKKGLPVPPPARKREFVFEDIVDYATIQKVVEEEKKAEEEEEAAIAELQLSADPHSPTRRNSLAPAGEEEAPADEEAGPAAEDPTSQLDEETSLATTAITFKAFVPSYVPLSIAPPPSHRQAPTLRNDDDSDVDDDDAFFAHFGAY